MTEKSEPTTSSSQKLPDVSPPDLSKIDNAPLSLRGGGVVVSEVELGEILSENSRLRYDNEVLEAEIAKLSGKIDIAEEKAKLIRPFSWWVLGFCSIYCLVIFAIIVVDASLTTFHVEGSVLPIMAGSTAAAVLGLVSVILTGLYRSD